MTQPRRLVGALGALVALCGVVSAAQLPVRDAASREPVEATTPTGTGSISGVVTSADASPAALRLVSVVLVGHDTGVMKLTMTDREGRFTFQQLPADRYAIAASKPPYLATIAGARRPGLPGISIALAGGQVASDVIIRMPRGAAISGTILDERGRPEGGVGVGVHPVRIESGVRRLAPAIGRLTLTDGSGRYRIHGLMPGSYAVVARSLKGNRIEHPDLTDAQVDAVLRGEPAPLLPASIASTPVTNTPVPVYFPGTTRMSDAQVLTVSAGDDRRQVDFQAQWGRTSRVEGTVSSANGQSISGAIATLTNEFASALQSTRTATVADGRFSIPLVPPGTYTLLVKSAGTPTLVGSTTVDVDSLDQLGVHLTLAPSITLSGRVTIEGSTTAGAFTGRNLGLINLSDGSSIQSRPLDATGSLTITDVLPGRYLVRPPLTVGSGSTSLALALQSVTVDGVDVTDLPLKVAQDTPPKEIVATFGHRWQQLSGRVLDSSSNGLSDYVVLMFPVDEAYWLYGSRRLVTTQPSTDGRFTFGGPGPAFLPAGDYYLAAVTDVSKDEQYDPAFLQSIIPAAIKVTLAPGGRQTQDLRVR